MGMADGSSRSGMPNALDAIFGYLTRAKFQWPDSVSNRV